MTWIRAAALVGVLVLVGVFLGSALSQREPVLPMPGTTPPVTGPDGERIRVEVLNGGGLSGAAREATDALRDRGFDVVFFGNAGSFGHDSSVVLDRVGSLDGARAVADALGIRNVRSEPDANLYLDVSVVLGTDWLPPDLAEAAAAPVRPWWDPRGWLNR